MVANRNSRRDESITEQPLYAFLRILRMHAIREREIAPYGECPRTCSSSTHGSITTVCTVHSSTVP